jgi:zinc transport system permease protein
MRAVAEHTFMRNALLSGLLASAACGVVGTLVVVRRIAFIAGGIAHCVLGGIGAAIYMQTVHGWKWLDPLYGALLSALLAAVVIGMISVKAKERTDTVIGAVWAIGMATGILFLARTPGYGGDLVGYLFGNILMVRTSDLWLLGILDLVVLVSVLVYYDQLMAVAFDEEYARTRGIPVDLFFIGLLLLTAVTIVLLVTAVGIVMMIALLTIPAAIAGRFATKLSHMMIWGAILTVVFTTTGLALSYSPGLPAGATVIILSGVAYLLVVLATTPGGRLRFLPAQRHDS